MGPVHGDVARRPVFLFRFSALRGGVQGVVWSAGLLWTAHVCLWPSVTRRTRGCGEPRGPVRCAAGRDAPVCCCGADLVERSGGGRTRCALCEGQRGGAQLAQQAGGTGVHKPLVRPGCAAGGCAPACFCGAEMVRSSVEGRLVAPSAVASRAVFSWLGVRSVQGCCEPRIYPGCAAGGVAPACFCGADVGGVEGGQLGPLRRPGRSCDSISESVGVVKNGGGCCRSSAGWVGGVEWDLFCDPIPVSPKVDRSRSSVIKVAHETLLGPVRALWRLRRRGFTNSGFFPLGVGSAHLG